MPGSEQHRHTTWGLGFKLSEADMKQIDHWIDFEYGKHDAYRHEPRIFLKILDFARSKFGREGVEYAFFHIILDDWNEWKNRYKLKIKKEGIFSSLPKYEEESNLALRKIILDTEQLILHFYSKYLREWKSLKKRLSKDEIWRRRLGINVE